VYALYFAQAMAPEQYQPIEDALIGAGHSHPEGRLFHFVLDTERGIDVFDVWRAREDFEAFRAIIRPLLAAHAVDGEVFGGAVRSLTVPPQDADA
jgi:hypothetical protein